MSSPFNLLIDTTVDGATIGVAHNSSAELIGFVNVPGSQGNSSALNTILADLLEVHGLRLSDLALITVARGPGSFTGIKVGLAFAYGLRNSACKQKPVIGYCPLAMTCAADDTRRWWVLGATRQRGAYARCRQDGSTYVADFALSADYDWPTGGAVLVKPWSELEARLEAEGVPFVRWSLDDFHRASMEHAAQSSKNSATDFLELPQPLYLRLSTAEEKISASTR